MAIFSLAIATTKAAYDTYLTAQQAVEDAQTDIDNLGARPAYPNVATTDSSYNNVTTSQDTYDSDLATAEAALVTAKEECRTAELAVITTLGYGTGKTHQALDQWVRVVGAGGGILTYTHYIGAATDSTYLTVSTTLPTQAFPNI